MTMMRAALFLLLALTSTVDAFPDHMQGTVTCMMDLSTDEVIMNASVLSHDDSNDPDVQIGYKTEEGEFKTAEIVVDKVPATFHFLLTNPNKVASIQYSIDTSAGARWEFGGCEDSKRATGKGDTTVNVLVVDEIPKETIQVWAGWATGHSAVSLTNVIELRGATAVTEKEELHEQVAQGEEKAEQQEKKLEMVAEEKKEEKVVQEKKKEEVVQEYKYNQEAVKKTPEEIAKEEEEVIIEELVEEVKEMEQVEEKEREEVQDELADDDAVNVGDLEHQIKDAEHDHMDPEMKAKMEDVMKNLHDYRKIHEAQQRADDVNANNIPDIDAMMKKYKSMMEKKQPEGGQQGEHQHELSKHWNKVRDRLAMENHTARFNGGVTEEQQRLMAERRAKVMQNHKGPESIKAQKLKDLAHRDNRWKEQLAMKREMLQGKTRAPDPEGAAEDEEEEEAKSIPLLQRRTREIVEEQDSDVALKEFLLGLLSVLIANWLVLQFCLWSEKKKKGRRSQ